MKFHRELTGEERQELESMLAEVRHIQARRMAFSKIHLEYMEKMLAHTNEKESLQPAVNDCDVDATVRSVALQQVCERLTAKIERLDEEEAKWVASIHSQAASMWGALIPLGAEMGTAIRAEIVAAWRPHFSRKGEAEAAADLTDTVRDIALFFDSYRSPFTPQMSGLWGVGTVDLAMQIIGSAVDALLTGQDIVRAVVPFAVETETPQEEAA